MEEYTCDTCQHVIIDDEYFMMIKGSPVTTTALLCTCDEVKDAYYNRFFKRNKIRIDAKNEMPVLIGNCHDYCRGIFYKKGDTSVLDIDDEL